MLKRTFSLRNKKYNFQFTLLSGGRLTDNFRDLGASQTTVEAETKKLEELKSIIFHEFRREVLNRLKKQSEKVLLNIIFRRHYYQRKVSEK